MFDNFERWIFKAMDAVEQNEQYQKAKEVVNRNPAFFGWTVGYTMGGLIMYRSISTSLDKQVSKEVRRLNEDLAHLAYDAQRLASFIREHGLEAECIEFAKPFYG